MNNRFYFGDDNDSATSLDDVDNDASTLPFPKPLDRSSFLVPDFDPATFLSSLSNRFQTLEDLQDELKELSQSLNKELVDLVNDNYQDFLSLGSTLSGGEEKVEEVRVGLLGFQRDITGVRDKVVARKAEVETLLREKKALRHEIAQGRALLEVTERLEELEHLLRLVKSQPPMQKDENDDVEIGRNDITWGDDWDEEEDIIGQSDEEEYDEGTGVSKRLRDFVEKYQIVQVLMQKHDSQHPLLVSLRERLSKVRNTVRMDLEAQVRREEDVKVKQKIIQLRSTLDE